jgi:opacity protein-like surface antigen
MKLCLALAAAAALLGAGSAMAAEELRVGVGAFGGISAPVLQDVDASSFSPGDAIGESGTEWGIRVPIKVIPVAVIEPYYAQSSYDDRTETFNNLEYTREGYDRKALGANFIFANTLAGGFKFYPLIGIGTTKLERTNEELNKFTWNFGLGLGFALNEKISVHVRSQLDLVVTDDTSRKFGDVTAGLQYNFQP